MRHTTADSFHAWRMLVLPLTLVILFGVMLAENGNCQAEGLGSSQWPSSLAQIRPPFSVPYKSADRRMQYRVAWVVVAALVVSFLCWFVAYPTILRRGRVWPVTLYGRCTAVAWCVSWGVLLAVFWDELRIPPYDTALKAQGLRCLVGFIALFFAIVWLLIWRSEKQAAR